MASSSKTAKSPLSINAGVANLNIVHKKVPADSEAGRPESDTSPLVRPYTTTPSGTEDIVENPVSLNWPFTWTQTYRLHAFALNVASAYTPEQILTLVLYLNAVMGRNLFGNVGRNMVSFTPARFEEHADTAFRTLISACTDLKLSSLIHCQETPVPGIHEDILMLRLWGITEKKAGWGERVGVNPADEMFTDLASEETAELLQGAKIGAHRVKPRDPQDRISAPSPNSSSWNAWYPVLLNHLKISEPTSSPDPPSFLALGMDDGAITSRKIPLYADWFENMKLAQRVDTEITMKMMANIMAFPVSIKHLYHSETGEDERNEMPEAYEAKYRSMILAIVIILAPKHHQNWDLGLSAEMDEIKDTGKTHMNQIGAALGVLLVNTQEQLNESVQIKVDELCNSWGMDPTKILSQE